MVWFILDRTPPNDRTREELTTPQLTMHVHQASLPLLALLAALVYCRANTWATLAAEAEAERSHAPSAARIISPLQSRTMQLMRYALRDQSRTKLLIMALQVLPAALELYGLVVLFVRIHRLPSPASTTLPLIVAAYLAGALLLCNTIFALHPTVADHPLLRFRLVKLGLQFLVLTFLLGAAEYDAFVRLLPPALISCGGAYMCVCVCFFLNRRGLTRIQKTRPLTLSLLFLGWGSRHKPNRQAPTHSLICIHKHK